jgi:hypothetical protein
MQDYKLVLRNITAGHTVFNPQSGEIIAQNASEFMSYLNEMYIKQGYTIHTVNSLRTAIGDVNTGLPTTYEFAYHLVKDVPEGKAPVGKDK